MSKRNTITWTHDLRVLLYRTVVQVLGHPEDVPRGSRGKPIGMSKARYLELLDEIGKAIGVGSGKGGALSNQIAWVTCMPSKKCHTGHWNNRAKNLAAADEAGYITKVVKPTVVKPITITKPASEPTSPNNLNPQKKGLFARTWDKLMKAFGQ